MTALALHGSRIEIAPGALAALGARVAALHPGRRVAIIADHEVAQHYAAQARASLVAAGIASPEVFTFPAGEQHKTRETWATLTDQLITAGYRRDAVFIALGGGVTGDLVGFVAATFLRGVPVVHVPTSLTAMIDASIGGKTGVDTAAGKNLVGAFHHPSLVLVDPTLLRTLAPQHLRQGLAEAIKHGVIADAAYVDWIAGSMRTILATHRDDATALRLVRRSVEIKVGVVAQDERERGIRKILNFGHTVGHAIEHVTSYAVPHGDAVAIGMVVEATLAERLGLATPGLAESIAQVCHAAGLPVRLPAGITAADIASGTRTDKKTRAGLVEYALPSGLGAMGGAESGFGIALPESALLETLQSL